MPKQNDKTTAPERNAKIEIIFSIPTLETLEPLQSLNSMKYLFLILFKTPLASILLIMLFSGLKCGDPILVAMAKGWIAGACHTTNNLHSSILPLFCKIP